MSYPFNNEKAGIEPSRKRKISPMLCPECKKPIEKPVTCVCHKYGSLGHEEEAWCSVACMERAHPDPPDIEDENLTN